MAPRSSLQEYWETSQGEPGGSDRAVASAVTALPRYHLGFVVRLFGSNSNLLLGLVVVASALYIQTAQSAPSIRLPITTPPGLPSWLDIYVVFPALAIVLVFVIRRVELVTKLVIGAVVVLPYVLTTFLWYFSFYHYAYWTTETQIGTLAGSVAVSTLLGVCFLYLPRLNLSELTTKRARATLLVGSAISLLASAGESLLRPITNSPDPIYWSGDIGIGVASGAFDLVHGINPYTHGLYPWGGPAALPYGPVSFMLATPFANFSTGIATHLATYVFMALCALMVWANVRLILPAFATVSALLFVSLPIVMGATEGTVSSHFMVTFLVLAATYAFLRRKRSLSGVLLSLATLTLVFPALLAVPMILYDRKGWLRFLGTFTISTAVGLGGLAMILAHPGAGSVATSAAAGGLKWTSAYQSLLGPGFGVIVSATICVGTVFVVVLRRFNVSESASNFLGSSASLLFMVPVMVGYSYSAFFLWPLAVGLIAIASRSKASKDPLHTGAGSSGESVVFNPKLVPSYRRTTLAADSRPSYALEDARIRPADSPCRPLSEGRRM